MSQIPGPPIPANLIDPTNLYVLYYRHGSNPNCSKFFVHSGTLHEAHELGSQHCSMMGFHYIFVRPFLSNFRDDEKKKLRVFGSGPVETTSGKSSSDSSSS